MKRIERLFEPVLFKSGEWFFGRELSPQVKPLFHNTLGKFQRGETVVLSEMVELLSGYQLNHAGFEHLEDLAGKPFILATNHFRVGPVGGFWQIFAINSLVKEMTGQEMRWMQGVGSKILPVVSYIHEHITSSTNNITADSLSGAREMDKMLQEKRGVGLHPEGRPSYELKSGDERVGAVFFTQAKKGVTIVPVATWREGKNLVLRAGLPLQPETIMEIGNSVEAEDRRKKVVDFVMSHVARLMPHNLRGAYAA